MGRLGLLIFSGIFLSWQCAFAAAPSSDATDQLASDKGCYLCHRVEPGKPNEMRPAAPSWKDIARKYVGQRDAEDRLTEIVLSGSGGVGKERHWKGKVDEVGMLPNIKEVDEDQARQLVHWILSLPRE